MAKELKPLVAPVESTLLTKIIVYVLIGLVTGGIMLGVFLILSNQG